METPLISIIIPVYNGEKYIKRCVDSIIKQTYNNFEIIIINDWSTDKTQQILWKYTDSHIKLINQENKWLWKTRNVWIKNATWDYLMFVDADDFLEDFCFENYINVLKEKDYDIILWWYKIYDWKKYKKREIKNNLFNLYDHTEPWNRIYKSSFINDNNILYKDLRSNEDLVFCLETYEKTDNIKIIANSWYVYFIENTESITKTMHKHFFPAFHDALNYNLKLYKSITKNKKYVEYKILKSAIVYLIFSGRYETSKNFIEEYKKIFKLLKSNFNIYITDFIFQESFLFNLVIQWFLFLDRLKLVPLFSKIWCK